MYFSTQPSNIRNDVSHPSEWAPSEWAEADTQMITGDDEEMFSSTSVQAASKVLEQWLSDGQHEPNQRLQDHHIDYDVPYVPVTPCDSSASSAEHDHDDATADLASLMEVDEQIGENLLGDDVFGGSCGVIEGEILHLDCSLPAFSATMNSFSALNVIDDLSEDDRRFLAPLLEDSNTTTMDYDAGYVMTDEGFSYPSTLSPSPILNQERYQDIIEKLEASMKRSQETRKSLTMKTPKMEEYRRMGSVTGVISSIESSSRQLQTFLQTVQQRQLQRTTK
jgi:hypothetical protein